MKNYYAILEAPVGCSLEEIRQAYHRLVQEHLDDEAVFADLKEAYEVLTTPSRRDEYDRAAWGETFESPSQLTAPAVTGPVPAGRCPMGAEGQCPVLQGRAELTDKFCPECGYLQAALSSGEAFELPEPPDVARQVWLEEKSGQTHLLRPGTNLVGRENADVLVPDKTVSRQHARLELDEAGNLTVQDLASTNGTQVNDAPLVPHVLRDLADGDRLRFGSIFLVLHLPGVALGPSEAAAQTAAGSMPPAEVHGQLTEMREGSSRVYPLMPGLTTFGRRTENNVVLTDDLYVSGSHAQVHAEGDVFVLTDLGSTNGTLLNGERLKINTPVTLDLGDVILIGGTALRLDRFGATAEDIDAEEFEEDFDDADDAQAAETAPAEIGAEDVFRHAEG